jgi:histidinol-phosphate aminotransferase
VVDEAYHYFGAPSVLELIEEYENIIVFRTFSKAYGLAGLRIGFMVSQTQNIDNISKSRSLVESNTLSMQIAEYFLEHPELRDQHVQEVNEGSAYLQEELNQLEIRWYGGKYTNGILIFLKDKEASSNLVAYLREKGIYIRGSFDAPFEATIRVSIGAVEYMEQFMYYFRKWLK